MSFFYKRFGIPRTMNDFFDLVYKGKLIDIYVKNSVIIIPSRHVIEYGLQHGRHSLTLEKYVKKIKLGEPIKNEDKLDIGKTYYNFMQSAIMTCEGFVGARLMPTINGESLERTKQKLNLLELRLTELEVD